MTGRTVATTYVGAVAVVAAAGFVTDSTPAILLAALLTLPSSSSGSATCSPDGICHGSTSGDLAPWFAVTTDVLGILALTGAALLNAYLVAAHLRRDSCA
jgi:hypothetical protein